MRAHRILPFIYMFLVDQPNMIASGKISLRSMQKRPNCEYTSPLFTSFPYHMSLLLILQTLLLLHFNLFCKAASIIHDGFLNLLCVSSVRGNIPLGINMCINYSSIITRIMSVSLIKVLKINIFHNKSLKCRVQYCQSHLASLTPS